MNLPLLEYIQDAEPVEHFLSKTDAAEEKNNSDVNPSASVAGTSQLTVVR